MKAWVLGISILLLFCEAAFADKYTLTNTQLLMMMNGSNNNAAMLGAMAAGEEDPDKKMMLMMMMAQSQQQAAAAASAKKKNEESSKKVEEAGKDDKSKTPMPTEYKNTFVAPKAPEENLELAGKVDLNATPQVAKAGSTLKMDDPLLDLNSVSKASIPNIVLPSPSAAATAEAKASPAVTTLSPIAQKDASYKAPDAGSGFGRPAVGAPLLGALQNSPTIKAQDNPVGSAIIDHEKSGGRRMKKEEGGEDRSIASEGGEEKSGGGGSNSDALLAAIMGQMNPDGGDFGVSLGPDLVEREGRHEPVPTLFEMASVRFQYAARYERRVGHATKPAAQ